MHAWLAQYCQQHRLAFASNARMRAENAQDEEQGLLI